MRTILVVFSMLFEAAAYAQDCTYWLETDEPVMEICSGIGGPIGSGRSIQIVQDWDEDGPDLTDPLAPVGNGPGQFNFNQFQFGEDWGGHFESPCWIMNGAPPAHPFFYIRIWAGHDTHCRTSVWMSSVVTLLPDPHDNECSGWTCVYYYDSWWFFRPRELTVRVKPGNLVQLGWTRPSCGFPDGYYVYRWDDYFEFPPDSTGRRGYVTETMFIDTLPDVLPPQLYWLVKAWVDD